MLKYVSTIYNFRVGNIRGCTDELEIYSVKIQPPWMINTSLAYLFTFY